MTVCICETQRILYIQYNRYRSHMQRESFNTTWKVHCTLLDTNFFFYLVPFVLLPICVNLLYTIPFISKIPFMYLRIHLFDLFSFFYNTNLPSIPFTTILAYFPNIYWIITMLNSSKEPSLRHCYHQFLFITFCCIN